MFSSLFILCSLGLTISSTLALPISTSELGPRQRNRFFGGNRGGAANAGAVAGACSDVMVFFARGTGENAPIGTIVGPPLKRALSSQLQGQTVSFEGTDYPANVQGFLRGGDAAGAANMAQSVTAAATNCPNSTIVMSGYRYEYFHDRPFTNLTKILYISARELRLLISPLANSRQMSRAKWTPS